jgi:DNA-binding MarR family transcriptional regulator
MAIQERTDPLTSTWSSYQRMRVQLAARLNQELARETGLSEADYEILCALIDSPGESARAIALRCGLEWEKSRLSHQLRRMEERGLVSRHICTEDNRGLVIHITDTGRELARDARRIHDQAVRRYVSQVLTHEQLKALGEISETILGGLGEPQHT